MVRRSLAFQESHLLLVGLGDHVSLEWLGAVQLFLAYFAVVLSGA